MHTYRLAEYSRSGCAHCAQSQSMVFLISKDIPFWFGVGFRRTSDHVLVFLDRIAVA
jgi:hypothetical protein